MRKSIITNIAVIYSIILIVALMATFFAYNRAVTSYVQDSYESALADDSERLAELVAKTANVSDDTVSFNNVRTIENVLARRLDKQLKNMNTSYAVVNKFGRTLYSSGVKGPDSDSMSENFFDEHIKKRIKSSLGDETVENLAVSFDDITYNVRIVPITDDISRDISGGWIVNYVLSSSSITLNNDMIRITVYVVLLSGIIVLVISYIMARVITKPIIDIKNAANSIAHYDFDSKVSVKTRNELGDLAESVNEMANALKKYDENMRRFVQNASHELKTPLMSIQGYAEGIKDGVFKDTDSALDIISDESQRLKRIVDNLILLTKLDSNDDFYTMKIENVNNIIDVCTDKVEGAFFSNGIELSYEALSEDIEISCDKDKITQAIINILSNCLRYAKKKVTICVELDRIFSKVFIKIRDDGEGFRNGEEKLIFERFYKGNQGQVGLGLSITDTIIRRHHGIITAYNAPGGGAEFSIELPAVNLKREDWR